MNTSSTTTPARIALVTGGATGIGAACSRELARAGFSVAIHYNSSDAAAKALSSELPGSFLVQGDLSKPQDVDHLYDVFKDKGGLEVVVNNAGATADAALFTAKLEDLDRILATNLKSTWYVTKRLSRLMMKSRKGRIVNISSVVGSTGNPGQSVYAMTKAAIDNFTKTAAQELAPFGILVNSVAPGFIQTRMTDELSEEIKKGILSRIPLGRMGQPEEIAQMVRFLAVEGSYCTGTVFHVNGGMFGG
jgi:3-oxoacyl-[acyl-carrier protein] reductase